MTLASFLLARIAEDEALARAAVDDDEHWLHMGGGSILQGDAGFRVSSGWLDLPHRFEAADHIARHDPARVLAECEAKRRIVETWQEIHDDPSMSENEWTEMESGLDYAAALLAAVYAEHSDYSDKWRP